MSVWADSYLGKKAKNKPEQFAMCHNPDHFILANMIECGPGKIRIFKTFFIRCHDLIGIVCISKEFQRKRYN